MSELLIVNQIHFGTAILFSDYTDTFTQYYILLRGFTHIFYRQLCRFIKSGKMMKATRTPHKHWVFSSFHQEILLSFLLSAAGRTRTGMVSRLILSQVRLPIPPQRLICGLQIFHRPFFIITQSFLLCKFFFGLHSQDGQHAFHTVCAVNAQTWLNYNPRTALSYDTYSPNIFRYSSVPSSVAK
mgnify:CR=1 FL=1